MSVSGIEVTSDFLALGSVLFARKYCDGRELTYPSWSAITVYILLESHDAFVEVVIVVGAYVDENTVAQDFAEVL